MWGSETATFKRRRALQWPCNPSLHPGGPETAAGRDLPKATEPRRGDSDGLARGRLALQGGGWGRALQAVPAADVRRLGAGPFPRGWQRVLSPLQSSGRHRLLSASLSLAASLPSALLVGLVCVAGTLSAGECEGARARWGREMHR